MTEEEWDNYDPSQENADAIIDIDMWNKGKDAEKTVNSGVFDKNRLTCVFFTQNIL